jgi:HK97 family phage prohead protease
MQIVSATQFKTINRGRNVTRAGLGVRKQMIAPAEQVGGEKRALRFTISTATVDRELDRIALAGWDLANFRRNPVVLWGHDATRLPIGRAFDLRIEDAALKASVEFIPTDTPEAGQFAEAVYRLALQGFIAATSVGFRPLKWDYTEDEARGADDWFPGIDFEEQELVELSVVTVPANPEALIEAPGPGEGTAIAADTPPVTGEEVTSLSADALNNMQAEIAARMFDRDSAIFRIVSARKQEEARARARRRRVFQLALATDG